MSTKRKVLHMICLCMIPILLVTSCGRRQEESVEENVFLKELEEQEEYDLTAQAWTGFSEIEKIDPGLTVIEYFDDFGKAPDVSMRRSEGYSATDQENYYRIQSYLIQDSNKSGYEHYLHSVNTATLETQTVKLAFEEAQGLFEDKEKETAYLAGADVSNGKLCAYLTIWNSDERDYSRYLAVWMDRNGTVEQVIDFLPAILDNRELNTSSSWFPTNTVYDPNGYYYVIDGSCGEIMVANESGEKRNLITLQDCREMSVSITSKAPDGSPVFEYESTDGQTVIFTLDGAEKTILFSGQGSQADIRKLDSYGRVIYLNNRQLLYWNASQGQCTCIYDASGISSFDCTAIMGNIADELTLFFEDGNSSYLYKLKWVPDFEPKEIMLLQWRLDEYTQNCAAEYSRKHPGTVITVYEPEDKSDVSFVRVVEDMKAGNGPDMLVVSREQLMEMEGAGALADLSDILPEQIQNEIFTGVLQYGVIGNKLYGIPYEASINTLLVSDEIWSEDTWTVQEIIELMEQNPTVKRCINISSGLTANQMLYDLCLINLEGSSFLDFQRQTCNFETEEFFALLKFCKEYGEASGSQGGEVLAYSLEGGLKGFSQGRARFDEGFHCVGYPTDGTNGSVVTCYRCIAVNQWTENMETIEDFMRFLLSEESQAAYTVNWVRRDVMTDHVREHTGISEGPVFIKDDHTVISLEGRADGSSYLDEYLTLMEEGAVLCTEYEIQNIILEEAAAYFSGDKSEQEAADVIQKRVQNYLDERK